jgi:TPR repeat protein
VSVWKRFISKFVRSDNPVIPTPVPDVGGNHNDATQHDGVELSELESAQIAYHNGDRLTAFTTYQTLAAKGNPVAKRLLAYMVFEGYLEGNYVELDTIKAVEMLRDAGEQGDMLAMYSLGACYANGLGVKKNEEESVRLYTIAAEAG